MKAVIAAGSLALFSSCAFGSDVEYTLYRTGIEVPTRKHDEALRIHVASFDAKPLTSTEDNAKYNLANYEIAAELFLNGQPHYRDTLPGASRVKLKYWCEKGRFRK